MEHMSNTLFIVVVQSVSSIQLFATPWTTACQAYLSFTISQSLLKLISIESVVLSNHHILCQPLLILPSSFPASESFPMSQLFASDGQRIGASASASVLPMNSRVDFFQDGLVLPPCSPWDSQESSPTPHFKSINSSVLSLIQGPTLISTHDYWKNHSFDQMYLCDAFAF